MWPRLESFGRGVAEQKKQTKMNIARKIALVTGGSRGLGRNIALALARNGADVILTYRQRKGEGEATAADIEQLGRKAALLQIDVADISLFDRFAKAVQQALEETWQRKSFDFLVNNAGVDSAAPFAQTSEESFDRLFLVHFKGVYFLTQKLLPMIADGGAIVCTSTGLARFAIPGYSAYASHEVFTRYLPRNSGHGESAPTSSPRARSRPTSPKAPLSSILRSKNFSLRRPRSAVSERPMTSAA